MKLRIILYSIIIAVIFATTATISAEKKMPPPNANKVWNYMTEIEPYSDWEHFPGHPGLLEGSSPHGSYVKIFANDPAIKAIENNEKLPPTSLIVKENYAKDKKTLESITPMYKVKGYNPEKGDWFWVKYSPKGKPLAEGKVKGCINCHKSQQENDWIFHGAH
ncbi:MAG: cytochrome P460 family protein [Thermodesulfobacteriota bacterium]